MLVVDDEPAILKWLHRALQEFGYDVVGAMDSGTALGIIQSSKIDALILDVRLADHSGLAALEFIRSQRELAPGALRRRRA